MLVKTDMGVVAAQELGDEVRRISNRVVEENDVSSNLSSKN